MAECDIKHMICPPLWVNLFKKCCICWICNAGVRMLGMLLCLTQHYPCPATRNESIEGVWDTTSCTITSARWWSTEQNRPSNNRSHLLDPKPHWYPPHWELGVFPSYRASTVVSYLDIMGIKYLAYTRNPPFSIILQNGIMLGTFWKRSGCQRGIFRFFHYH